MGPELHGFHLGVNEPFDFPHEVCQEERFQSNIQASESQDALPLAMRMET